jgi:thiol-disulfide isomerase/thioredoxin
MKTISCVCACLMLAWGAVAQSPKKFTSFADLSAHFDEANEAAVKKVNMDRLAAIEAFIADKANEKSPDLGSARTEAAQLAVELEKYDVVKKHAEVLAKDSNAESAMQGKVMLIHATAKTGGSPAELKAAFAKFLEEVPQEGAKLAYDAAGVVAEAMLDADDIEGAKEVWKGLGEKVSHPQIAKIVESATADLNAIGSDPKPFPETAKDLQGNALSIEKFKGKVLLIDFWATWCGPCIAELPNVVAAYKKHHDKGFEILGISLDNEDKTKLDKFLASHAGMTWPQFYDGKGWKNEIAQLYGVKSIPATYLLDQNGKVYRTGLRGKALERAVQKLLAKGGTAPKKS